MVGGAVWGSRGGQGLQLDAHPSQTSLTSHQQWSSARGLALLLLSMAKCCTWKGWEAMSQDSLIRGVPFPRRPQSRGRGQSSETVISQAVLGIQPCGSFHVGH